MDGYRVDLQQMGILIDNMVEAAERISGANDMLREATPAQLGSHEIDRAGRAFQDRWEYGTKKIGEGVRHLAGALQQTRREYQRAEDEVSRLCSAGAAGRAGSGSVTAPGSAIPTALDGSGS